jgi:hypothetical protein
VQIESSGGEILTPGPARVAPVTWKESIDTIYITGVAIRNPRFTRFSIAIEAASPYPCSSPITGGC